MRERKEEGKEGRGARQDVIHAIWDNPWWCASRAKYTMHPVCTPDRSAASSGREVYNTVWPACF